MLGPLRVPPLPDPICSPVGMVPKKESTKMRMITHLSYPHGNSINSHMDPADTTTCYQSFDKALEIWDQVLRNFKGWLPIPDLNQWKQASMVIYTDTSANPNLGWGIYVPSHKWWLYGRWDPVFFMEYHLSIDFLKMYVILIFLDSKGKEIENHHLQFFSDNQPTVDALTSKSSPSSQLMTIIRIIALICLHHNIHFTILHVKGKFNTHADLLSRIKLDKFMQQVEDMRICSTRNPRAKPGHYPSTC